MPKLPREQIGDQVMGAMTRPRRPGDLIDGMELMFTAYPSANTMGPRVTLDRGGQDRHGADGQGGIGHAWFMGFSPVDEPRSLCGIHQYGSARRVSVPVARDFLARTGEQRHGGAATQ